MSGWRWAFAHRSISHLSLAPLCTFRRLTGAAVSAAPRCMAEGSPGGKCSRQGGAGRKWGRFSSPSASGCVSGAVLASGDAVNQASSNSACCLCPARLGMRVLPSLLISGLSHYPVCLPCPSVHPWIPCIQFPCAHFLVTLCPALISWYVRSTPHAERSELASSSAALPCLLALCVPDTDPLFAAGTHCASSARRLGSGAAQPPRVTVPPGPMQPLPGELLPSFGSRFQGLFLDLWGELRLPYPHPFVENSACGLPSAHHNCDFVPICDTVRLMFILPTVRAGPVFPSVTVSLSVPSKRYYRYQMIMQCQA